MKTNTQNTTSTALDLLSLRPYLRVSVDTSGVGRSNTEQLDAIDTAVNNDPSWVLSTLPAYADVGSASKYAKRRRADFDALVADLTHDTFDDDGLIIWEGSRATRKVSEWLMLLELLAERGKVVVVVTHGPRLYNPGNSRDWRTLVEDAVDSEYETRKTSARVGRNTLSTAQAGTVPGGRRMFGYDRTGMVIDPAERAVLLEAIGKVLAGTTTRQIAKDWNRRGITTTAGNEWHPTVVRSLLRNPRLAALRVHHKRVVGNGVWPPIIDEPTHRRLAAVLNAAPRAARGKSPWVLTGFLRCDLCGRSLVGNVDSGKHHPGGTRRYVCRKAVGYHGCGKLSIRADHTEALIGVLISERATDVDRRRKQSDNDSVELAELDRVAADRIELADAKAAGRISMATMIEQAAALDRVQRQVESVLASKVQRSTTLDLVAAEGLVGRGWSQLDVDEQRLVVGAFINTITVAPATTRGSKTYERARVAAPDRIDWKA